MKYSTNITYHFFWWVSGVNIGLLKNYPHEYEKYFHIGLTIFLTWVLATISGSIAFIMVFESNAIGVSAGCLWGIFIFNIDRFITISMKKTSNELTIPLISESIKTTIQILLPALPRFMIAILLGIVISKPLELHIFKDSIHKYQGFIEEEIRNEKELSIKKRYKEYVKNETNKIDVFEKKYKKRNEFHQKEINNIILKIQEKRKNMEFFFQEENKNISKLRSEYIKELDGSGGTENRGYGVVAREKKKIMGKFQEKLEKRLIGKEIKISNLEKIRRNLEKKHIFYNEKYLETLSQLRSGIQSIYIKKDEELSNYIKSINKNGLLNKIESLNRAIENNNVIYWLHKIIILLIIILETSPIFIKLISSCDAYETYVDKINRIQIMNNEYEIKIAQRYFTNEPSLCS